MSKRKLPTSYSTLRRQVRAQVDADMRSLAGHDNSCSSSDDEFSDNMANTVVMQSVYTGVNSDGSYTDGDYSDDRSHHLESHASEFADYDWTQWTDSGSNREETDSDEESVVDQISQWANKYSVTQVAITDLMHILKPFLHDLPKCARTLLCTPRTCSVRPLNSGGEYCHLGLANGLLKTRICGNALQSKCLKVQFNVDGVPLFKSSNTTIWPILCLLKNADNSEPFVVGIYSGNDKPADATEFLAEFVSEASELVDNGVVINDEIYTLKIHAFVCDAPARAFVKGIKHPSGYSACEKCTEYGEYDKKVIYRRTDRPLRTDVAFDEMADEQHHSRPCPLKPLQVGCVSQFGLDYMHLVCLGVMRRLLLYWKGPVGPLCVRLGRRTLDKLSQKLVSLCPAIPSDFVRKPRTVTEVLRWKATEFRQFLLYTGPVILHEILTEKLYHHFMLLSVAIRILASAEYSLSFADYANELLILFVNEAGKLYGNEIYVYNVHCLIHLASDVRNLGPLDYFSAFPFENKLGQLKRMVRKPQFPLQQIVNRLAERQQSVSSSAVCDQSNENSAVKNEHNTGPVLPHYRSYRQYKSVQTKSYRISLSVGNNCILTTEGYPALVQNILCAGDTETVVLMCNRYRTTDDAFSYPLLSSRLGIYKVGDGLSQLFALPLRSVAKKCAVLPVKDSFVILPLLH